jgi:hypothetical protein
MRNLADHETRLRDALDAMGPAPRAELLHTPALGSLVGLPQRWPRRSPGAGPVDDVRRQRVSRTQKAGLSDARHGVVGTQRSCGYV